LSTLLSVILVHSNYLLYRNELQVSENCG